MSYHVIVTREDGQWLADVPELDGAHTWARSLPALDRAVRVVVLAADLPDEDVDRVELDFEYHTGEDLIDERAARLRSQRATLDEEYRDLARDTEQVASALAARYSVRDAAMLTGVSYQRVSQLTRKAA